MADLIYGARDTATTCNSLDHLLINLLWPFKHKQRRKYKGGE